jgi:hypothetical protein
MSAEKCLQLQKLDYLELCSNSVLEMAQITTELKLTWSTGGILIFGAEIHITNILNKYDEL